MADDGDDFLRRWSRRKRAAARQAAAPAAPPAPARPAEPLPPAEQLTPESDFRAFMDRRVDRLTRNLALKKLFADPRFNVIDELDIDIDDYSKLETLSEEAVAKLEHARRVLFGPEPEPRDAPPPVAQDETPPRAAAPEQPAPPDEPGPKDA